MTSGREASLHGDVHGQVQHRQLQPRAPPGQEVEPGTGDLGPAGGVDEPQPLAQGQVVEHLDRAAVSEIERLAHLAQHLEVRLTTCGHPVGNHVGQSEHRLGQFRICLSRSCFRLLHGSGQLGGLGDEILFVLAGRFRDPFAHRLLLRP